MGYCQGNSMHLVFLLKVVLMQKHKKTIEDLNSHCGHGHINFF